MSIRSPYIIQKKVPQTQTRDAILNLHEIGKVVDDLKALKERITTEHVIAQTKRDVEHRDALARIETKIYDAHAHIKTIVKGQKGDSVKGDKGETPKIADIVEALKPHIPAPIPGAPGKNAVIDEKKLVKRILALIPPSKEVTLPAIEIPTVESLVEEIKKKKLLTKEHVAGLTEEIASYRNQLAGKHYGRDTWARGGGDTVAAGSNITITTVNGVKTISSSGSGGSGYQAPTSGAIDGSNQIFVWATAPNVIVVDGGRSMQKVSSDGSVNWTGTTTTTLTVAPNFDVFATA